MFADVPHHITQRGNRREPVFFSDDDRHYYIKWLGHYSKLHGLDILAYCLMDNHIHLVAVPNTIDSMHLVMRPLNMRYAQRINRGFGWSGHLWQGRFYSSPLDDTHMWQAIRYVNRNPVRAGMVAHAQDYVWSSAAYYCGNLIDPLITKCATWAKRHKTFHSDWQSWLGLNEPEQDLLKLRQCFNKGLPCGNDDFVGQLELRLGRSLRSKKVGRPKK
ncbi:transposase [Arsukibacterium ikkense]|uniref:transposase n=1 Tax=Arsukibacterium ikkense TaxID=336831 RepID=UPI0006994599|nr:transposase [Arsukibacterium ikkense]